MFKQLLTLLVLLQLVLNAQNNLVKVDSLLNNLEASDEFYGVVLVAKGDTILLLRAIGYTDETKEVKLKTDTKFDKIIEPGFISRLITLQLIKDGRLSLKDSIGKYLDIFNNDDDKSFTIERILSRCSSVKECNFIDISAIQNLSKDAPFFITPSNISSVSFQRIIVLWKLIEIVTNKSYKDAVKEMIFDKAGMTESVAGYDENLENVAKIIINNLNRAQSKSEKRNLLTETSGFYLTAHDYMKFIKAIFTNESFLAPELRTYILPQELFNQYLEKQKMVKYDSYMEFYPVAYFNYDTEFSTVVLMNKFDRDGSVSDYFSKFNKILLDEDFRLRWQPALSKILFEIIDKNGMDYFKENFTSINNEHPIENPRVLNFLANNLDTLQRTAEAIEILKINLEMFPKDEPTNRRFGNIYLRLEEEELANKFIGTADVLHIQNEAIKVDNKKIKSLQK